MANGSFVVRVVGDVSNFKSSMNDAAGVLGKFEAKVSGVGSRLKGFGSAVVGGIFGGGLVAGFSSLQTAVQGVVNEYSESLKVGRETERVIRTTGGAAHVTAKQVEELATALSNKTGVDDEQIQSAANLLLTFTNVRNELGKGNDVFSRAVALSGDMAAALGTDSRSAALQLGKALNDPIKGLTALSRAGVSFTQQQKDQIRWAMFFGDTLSAQKIILGEVQREFGGAAEAAATPLDKLKVKFQNFQESIGRWSVDTAVPWLREMWPKVQEEWNKGIEKARQIIEPFLNVVQILWARFGDNVLNGLRGFWNATQAMFQGIFETIKSIVEFFLALIQGDWSAAWTALGGIVSGAWQFIIGAIQSAWNLIISIFGIAWEALTAIFGALWDEFKSMVSSAWGSIAGFVSSGIDTVVGFVAGLPGRLLGFVGSLFGAAASLGRSILDGIVSGVSSVVGIAGDIAAGIHDAIAAVVNPPLSWIESGINSAIDVANKIPFVDIGHVRLPRFHEGGVVPGMPGEEVLAVLQAGERVIPANAANLPRVGGLMSSSVTGSVVNITVQGSVVTERELIDVVHEALLRKKRQTGDLGLV